MKTEAETEWVVPCAPYLGLLGDIGTPALPKQFKDYEIFLNSMADKFSKVYLLTGNHEYYVHGGARAAECPLEQATMKGIDARVERLRVAKASELSG